MICRRSLFTTVLVSALLATGCGGNSNNSTEGAETSGDAGGSGTSTPVGNTGNTGGGNSIADYNGNWSDPCVGDGDPEFGIPDSIYEVVNLSINGNTGVAETFSYMDAACSVPTDEESVIRYTVSFAYPGGTTNTSLGVARHINVTTEEILIDGAQPSAEVLALMQSVGAYDTEYDLILIAEGKLYFGESLSSATSGDSAATRPTEIDTEFPFVRQ